MTLWIDADSCPAPLRRICLRSAMRVGIAACFVANRTIPLPAGCETIVTDDADGYILSHIAAGDLIVTNDLSLTASSLRVGATAIDSKGRLPDIGEMQARLALRSSMSARQEAARSNRHGSTARRGQQADARLTKHFAAGLDRALRRIV